MPCVGQTPVECRLKNDCKTATAKKVSGQHEKKMPVNTWQHKAIKLNSKKHIVSKESENGGPKMVHNNFTVSAQAQLNLNFSPSSFSAPLWPHSLTAFAYLMCTLRLCLISVAGNLSN